MFEFCGLFRYHEYSPLVHNMRSKERHNFETSPTSDFLYVYPSLRRNRPMEAACAATPVAASNAPASSGKVISPSCTTSSFRNAWWQYKFPWQGRRPWGSGWNEPVSQSLRWHHTPVAVDNLSRAAAARQLKPSLIHLSNCAWSADGDDADIKRSPNKDESKIRLFGDPTIHVSS